MTFAVHGPGERALKADECGTDDAKHYDRTRTPEGKTIHVQLCFTAHKAESGRMLVPYAIKTARVRMPDGTIVDNVPEGLSRADFMARLQRKGHKSAEPSPPKDPSTQPGQQKEYVPPEDLLAELDNMQWWTMGERYSAEVTSYVEAVGTAFVLSADDAKEADRRLWDARLSQLKEAAQVMFGGLAVGWFVVACIGWVARGFLGIPRGKDERAAKAN